MCALVQIRKRYFLWVGELDKEALSGHTSLTVQGRLLECSRLLQHPVVLGPRAVQH